MRTRNRKHVVTRKLADGTTKTYIYDRARNVPKKSDEPAPLELPEPGTIQHLVNAYKHSVEWYALKGITQRHYATYLREWERPALAKFKVTDITRRQIRSLRSNIARKRGIAAANVFVRVTASWFKWLLGNDWIEYSPTLRIDPLPGGGKIPTWQETEFEHAVRTFPEHLRRAIILARYTGQRRGDLIAMRWSAYKDGVIVVQQEKGKRSEAPITLHLPVHSVLRAELDTWKAEARSVFMLTTDRGKPWNPTYLSRLIGEAVAANNLPPRLNIHGLRKLAATTLAEIGCTPHDIMAFTGHRTLAMVQHYTDAVSQKKLAHGVMERWEQSKPFTKITRIYNPGKDE